MKYRIVYKEDYLFEEYRYVIESKTAWYSAWFYRTSREDETEAKEALEETIQRDKEIAALKTIKNYIRDASKSY